VVVCPGHGPCTTVGAERGTPPGAPRPGPGRGR
jgi:hypothetical protein